YRVYSDPTLTADDVRAHEKAYGYTGKAILDHDSALALRTGVDVTPEAVVFDANGRLQYRGRIDDRYVRLGVYKAQAEHEDLSDALQAVLKGETPSVQETKGIGCFIPLPPSAPENTS